MKNLQSIRELKGNVQLIDLVSLGQKEAVEELIKKSGKNFDVNEMDACGNLAVIIAAERNDFPLLKLLVENGARLDLEDSRGRTVKGWAEKNKNQAMLEFINDNDDLLNELCQPSHKPIRSLP